MNSQPIELQPAEPSTDGAGRVRVRTLVVTRWLAVFGQLATLLIVSEAMHVKMPMLPAMLAVGCSGALNLYVGLRRGLGGWHSDREAAAFLAYDILQLAALLYLTGGLTNPFALLMLVPVTISATILSLGSTVGLGLLAFGCISLLSATHLPLPWPTPDFSLPPIYNLAMWISLVLGMTFLMFYAWRVAEEARRMSAALAATQLALGNEQELSALGALAAATAHELGTPLGTIALIGKELSREVADNPSLSEDIELLNNQAARCRDILAQLSRNPRAGADRSIVLMRIDALAAELAEVHQRSGVDIEVTATPLNNSEAPPPVLRRSPELVQGLGNLIENAVEFARHQVRIETAWNDVAVRIDISDDGRGFTSQVLTAIGEPYISTRPGDGRMGLGVFISKTLLERTGATLRFANSSRSGGARIIISWPRELIESRQDVA